MKQLFAFVIFLVASHAASASEAILKQAQKGDVNAQVRLGGMYREGDGVAKDLAEAAKWFRISAERGHPEGQYELGSMYWLGEGVPENNSEAFKWFLKAAKQGNSDAQLSLGNMYFFGSGPFAIDEVEGLKWFRKAAEQGDSTAQCRLGICYAQGTGVIKDLVEAHAWFNVSGANGFVNARGWLANTEESMTREQIAEATKRAKVYFNKYQKKKR